MENTYQIELTGKQLILLCNCIDERINSNNLIKNATQKNQQRENRSLRSLQRYFTNIKHPDKEKKKRGTPP